MIAVVAVVSVFTFIALSLAEVRVSRHRAAAAADLAAVAGAAAWPAAAGLMCDRARAAASLNGVVVADCQVAGASITVRVTAMATGALAGGAAVTARARAQRDTAQVVAGRRDAPWIRGPVREQQRGSGQGNAQAQTQQQSARARWRTDPSVSRRPVGDARERQSVLMPMAAP